MYINPLSTWVPVGITVPEKSVMEILNVWKLERKKIQLENKKRNKQQKPDSGIQDVSTHCPLEYQVSTL